MSSPTRFSQRHHIALQAIPNLKNIFFGLLGMPIISLLKMTDENRGDRSKNMPNNIIMATSGWKVVYNINNRYFVEDIIAYAFVSIGNSYELIPLTLPDLHLCQPIQEYVLKDGYIGLIDPHNELIVNEYLDEERKEVNLKEIRAALSKNRYKLE